ncbi:MAG: Holliday junction ATP-dependent DNA helicase RuvA [Bacillota bacterium]|nr:Holliday junction ATP-dependent DNA helicase RuvA [Bacillota bacterium]
MISAITGKLVRVQEDRVVIQVGGLSYDVLVSPSTARVLAARRDEEVRLETIFYIQGTPGGVGNTVPVLVGFLSEVDKDFFEHFITVGGIGPRAALKALAIPAPRVARAIESGDIVTLSSLPGIGKQKAAKIVAELKGKVTRFALWTEEEAEAEAGAARAGLGAGARASEPGDEVAAEALEVLLQLGYRRQEAEEMIRQAMAKRPDVRSAEAIIQEIYRSTQRDAAQRDASERSSR